MREKPVRSPMVPPIADSSGEARDDHTEPEQSDDATVGGDIDQAV